MWVRRDGAFPQLVSAEVFKNAQEAVAEACRRYTDEELLDLLKRLLSRVGKLDRTVITTANGMPCTRTYSDRFGGILKAYRLIGYVPPRDFSYVGINETVRVSHQQRINALVADLESEGATVHRDAATDLITINDELRFRFMTVRCCRAVRPRYRWFFRFDPAPSCDIDIAARMGPKNDSVLDYFIVPRFEKVPNQLYSGAESSALNIYRFSDLSVLKTLVRRTRFMEAV